MKDLADGYAVAIEAVAAELATALAEISVRHAAAIENAAEAAKAAIDATSQEALAALSRYRDAAAAAHADLVAKMTARAREFLGVKPAAEDGGPGETPEPPEEAP